MAKRQTSMYATGSYSQSGQAASPGKAAGKLRMVTSGTLHSDVYAAFDRAGLGYVTTTQEWAWDNGHAAVKVDPSGNVWVSIRAAGATVVREAAGLLPALRALGVDVSGLATEPSLSPPTSAAGALD